MVALFSGLLSVVLLAWIHTGHSQPDLEAPQALTGAVQALVHPNARPNRKLIVLALRRGKSPSGPNQMMQYMPHFIDLAQRHRVRPPGTNGTVSRADLAAHIAKKAMRWAQSNGGLRNRGEEPREVERNKPKIKKKQNTPGWQLSHRIRNMAMSMRAHRRQSRIDSPPKPAAKSKSTTPRTIIHKPSHLNTAVGSAGQSGHQKKPMTGRGWSWTRVGNTDQSNTYQDKISQHDPSSNNSQVKTSQTDPKTNTRSHASPTHQSNTYQDTMGKQRSDYNSYQVKDSHKDPKTNTERHRSTAGKQPIAPTIRRWPHTLSRSQFVNQAQRSKWMKSPSLNKPQPLNEHLSGDKQRTDNKNVNLHTNSPYAVDRATNGGMTQRFVELRDNSWSSSYFF